MTDDTMTLHEALEHQANGTLPPSAPLSAAEAIEAVLQQDRNGDRGWELQPSARVILAGILKSLKEPSISR